MTDPKNTLDKIQNEIRDNLKREHELKNGHHKLYEGLHQSGSSDGKQEEANGQCKVNGNPKKVNGVSTNSTKTNGFIRRFTPNASSKGIMNKFFKNRGKINTLSVNGGPNNNNIWYNDASLTNFTIDQDKPLRNGYVPAEEKIFKEITDFQQREAELRMQRRQSQPDLMAGIDFENNVDPDWNDEFKGKKLLKHTKSMANLYQGKEQEDDVVINSAPPSLKPARSLADLCDIPDDEIEMPGTHSLIARFEKYKV